MMSLARVARLFGWIALVVVAARLPAAEIPRGRVLEQVACTADPSHTYALYVPTAFTADRKWPVLLCFDPGARGKVPVERFQAAAEKYGWLLAGSNTSRNGPWEANAAAINAMVNDLNRHLPLDPKRLYAAGLSGGARVAGTLAASGIVQGVIACSAGFAGGETPSKVPFLFFGTAGVTDFNYRELRRVDRELDDRKAVHRVVIFDGGHEWLPPALATQAVEWFELQAMRGGTRAKDLPWLQAQFEARSAGVPAEPLLETHRALKSLVADFKALADTTAAEKRLAEMGASREFKDAQKAAQAADRAEEALLDNLLSAIGEGFGTSVRKTIAELQAKAGGTGPDRAMATRVLSGVASTCGEAAREALRTRDYETAAAMMETVVLLRPERPQGYFDLARARAQLGDRKRALAALQDAVAAGFTDATRLREEKAFEKLRGDPAFGALIDRLGSK